MATCTTEKAEVTYVLRLSAREAHVLRDVCTYIGGDPNGPRGCMDSIKNALGKSGVTQRALRNNGDSIYLPDTFPSDYP